MSTSYPTTNPVYTTAHFVVTLKDPSTNIGSFAANLRATTDFMERAYSYYAQNSGIGDIGQINVQSDASDQGLGAATGGSILYLSGGVIIGYPNYVWIASHELFNQFTGHLASGWVWANGSELWHIIAPNISASPGPAAANVQALRALGFSSAASDLVNGDKDPGFVFLLNIFQNYGWRPYAALFTGIRRLGLNDWHIFSEPLRTVVTFLIMTVESGIDFITPLNDILKNVTFSGLVSGVGIPQSLIDQAKVLLSQGSPSPPSSGAYNVCTYMNGSGTAMLSQTPIVNGGLFEITPNQSYTLTAGAGFQSWSQSDGVHIANLTAANTTVTFDANTRATCVGNLTVNFGGGGAQPSTPAPPPPPSGHVTLTITLTDQTAGLSVNGPGGIGAYIGDIITISGDVFPGPSGGCSNCVDLQTPMGSIGKVGIGSLGPTKYLYGPVAIPAGSTDFWVKAVYMATGESSPTINVTLQSAPPSPPPPPQQERYSCVNGQCVPDQNGAYSNLTTCQTACIAGGGGGTSNTDLYVALAALAATGMGAAYYYESRKRKKR